MSYIVWIEKCYDEEENVPKMSAGIFSNLMIFFLYSCSLLKYGNDSQFCYEQRKKSSNHSLESGMSLYSSGVLFIFMLWQNVVSRVFTTLTIVIRKPFVNSDIYNMMMIPGPSSVTQRTKNLKRWVIFQDFCPLCSNGQLYINTV
mgnify:CR=1 FL=1